MRTPSLLRSTAVLALTLLGCGEFEAGSSSLDAVKQSSSGAWSCDYTVVDGYGHPVANTVVSLHVEKFEKNIAYPVDSEGVSGVTDANGHVVISTTYLDNDTVNYDYRLSCSSVGPHYSISGYPGGPTTGPTLNQNIVWTELVTPHRKDEKPACGLDTSGCGKMRLYQSGAYDKVIVIAEGFNTEEKRPGGARSEGKLWLEYNGHPNHLGGWSNTLLVQLYQQGYDVWLFQPNRTGDNVHEQAAEFAQALNTAATYGPALDGKVTAMGFSLGGLVARVATARWYSDSLWRTRLGLSEAPPVRLVIVGDAPLRGANLNEDLQVEMWKQNSENENNFNSCAAQQMLMNSCHELNTVNGVVIECDDKNWNAFYNTGSTVSFQSGGAVTTCTPGPAVLTLGGGNGWAPGIPRIAWSQGTLTSGTGECYGDSRDLNGDRADVCPGVGANTFIYGTPWLNIKITNWPDKDLNYTNECGAHTCVGDLEPGSRHDALFYGFIKQIFIMSASYDQWRHAGTFIPTRSAMDVPNTSAPITFTDYWVHSYNATHRAISNAPGANGQSVPQWLLAKLGQYHVTQGQGGETVWVEDSVPAGAQALGSGEGWSWVGGAHSGALAHVSDHVGGMHQHYFLGASATLPVGSGEKLFTYVYLDPSAPPREVMLQWYDSAGWEHRAYWGEDLIAWGAPGTASRRYMGPLPAAGQWVRLEVPASAVGLEGSTVNGMAFTLFDGRAWWDRAGKAPAGAEQVWLEDGVPAGATPMGYGEAWSWVGGAYSGALAHESTWASGIHQHYFEGATATLPVAVGDTLFTYVRLDPSAPPRTLMLQWNDGSWEHRAYWGEDLMPWGAPGTGSRRYMGPLPAAGQWVRLEVPASAVGLEGSTVTGMAFTLYDGKALWDRTGKRQ